MMTSARKLFRLSALLVVVAASVSAQACSHHSTLHASHGVRLHEVMAVQQSVRSSRPIVVRGEEVTRYLARHDKQFERELQAARQTASQSNLGASMMNH